MMSIIKKIMTNSLLLLAALVFGSFKISYIVGSYAAGFTFSNCVVPLAGLWSGLASSTLLVSVMTLFKLVRASVSPFALVVHHLPGYFSSLYFAINHWAIRCVLPLLCMALFILHPTGGQAWQYTLLWLVPVVVSLSQTRLFFAHAFASTCIAHAVGSTLWIYHNPMTTQIWLALIPVVLVERLLFASGMTLVHAAVGYAQPAFKTTRTWVACMIAR